MAQPTHVQILQSLSRDRRLAHKVLFKHRHPFETPPFHGAMIDDFHGQDVQVVIEAFRGGGKSTIGEEAMCIRAVFEEFANGVIVSATQARAIERLTAIKHELENNVMLAELFVDQKGDPWQAQKIVLTNGTCIQALGVGQAVRGIKHLENRPDFIWIDDIEDEESTKTAEACKARLKWLYATLLPVCAKNVKIRVTGNRLSAEAVVTKLASNPAWRSSRYPICHKDIETAREVATWPEYRDMDWIAEKRTEYETLGLAQEWASEYMCEAISDMVKPFEVSHYKRVHRIRTWEPVFVLYDPAKTSKDLRQQSHYAKAAVSWLGRKLVIWDCWGKAIMPSELISDIFASEQEYSPVAIKVEADGLEDWLREPLRIEQTRRRILLPHLGDLRAPRDKDRFIKSLAPFFASGDIECAGDFPQLRAQIENYPSGRKDILNVIAYALQVRPGDPVYENFSQDNIVEELDISIRTRRFLCLNADGNYVTAVLAQYDGALQIIADWIEPGDPGQVMEPLLKRAQLAAGGTLSIVLHPKECDSQNYYAKGLVAALRRIPRQAQAGAQPERGRAEIRELLSRRSQMPLLQVNPQATWTLRALSGGYCKVYDRKGHIAGEPEDGAYKTLMEGLEAFAGIMHHEADEDGIGDTAGQWRTSARDGRIYRSLIGDRRRHGTEKRSIPSE